MLFKLFDNNGNSSVKSTIKMDTTSPYLEIGKTITLVDNQSVISEPLVVSTNNGNSEENIL